MALKKIENCMYCNKTKNMQKLYWIIKRFFFNRLFKIWTSFNFPWFDHRLDELNWPNNLFWVERGVFGRRYIKEGNKVLDLCCGDAYFSKYFYSTIKNVSIDAVDMDKKALSLAKSFDNKENIVFKNLDIVRDDFSSSKYNVILWFEGIEHISKKDCKKVFEKIGRSIEKGGILLGSTPIVSEIGGHNWQHCNEFLDVKLLQEFLEESFKNVEIWTSTYPEGNGERKVGYFLVLF